MKNLLTILFFVAMLSISNAQSGSLVIVGGALESGNEAVYQKFIELATNDGKQKIGIIPAASGSPVTNAESFKQILMSYQVKAENIDIIPLAWLDDAKTQDVDETTWRKNADSDETVKQIESCTAIWFIGGDQMNITQLLVREDKTHTKSLNAIRKVFENGGVIGGTSAGAAIMSEEMICGGTSMGALINGISGTYTETEKDDYTAICLDKGLGFFPHGIVDQHFDKRARIGRLIVAANQFKEKYTIAIGINENSACIYHAADSTLEFIGGATLIDISQMIASPSKKMYKNVLINYLSDGDTYNIRTKEIKTPNWKKATVGNEYYNSEEKIRGGILSPGNTFYDLLTAGLLDNKALQEVKSYSFGEGGKGFEIKLIETPNSAAFWGQNQKGEERYTVKNVIMNIVPVKIKVKY